MNDTIEVIEVAEQGLDGPPPTITWNGTQIIVNGVPGPDLQGPAVVVNVDGGNASTVFNENSPAIDGGTA